MLGGVTEAEALLAKLAAEETIDPETAIEPAALRFEDLHATLGSLRSPIQPLHGDAHLNNVLNGRGPLWNDWEDTCLGPVGWDAACLTLHAATAASERRRPTPPPASASTRGS